MVAILVLVVMLCVVMVIVKSRQPKPPKDSHKVIKINTGHSKPTHSREYHEQKRKRRDIRSARLDRHRRIWSVLFLTNSIHELEQAKKSGFVPRQLIKQIETAKAAVIENSPKASDIKTAIRFIKIENYRGKCDHPLTPSDITKIMHIHDTAIAPPIQP